MNDTTDDCPKSYYCVRIQLYEYSCNNRAIQSHDNNNNNNNYNNIIILCTHAERRRVGPSAAAAAARGEGNN